MRGPETPNGEAAEGKEPLDPIPGRITSKILSCLQGLSGPDLPPGGHLIPYMDLLCMYV